MKSIKTVEEFKKFIKDNHDVIYADVVPADNIALDDEWMQDNKWDEQHSCGYGKGTVTTP